MTSGLRPLKWYKSLSSRKGRLAAGCFLVEGERAVNQVIAGYPGEVLEILVTDQAPPVPADFSIRELTDSQFNSISGTRTPQGIMAVVKSPAGIYSDSLPGNVGAKVLLLENIQDPGNAGTLIRTAAAFDYAGIIMTESCADPLSPKCVQSTAGSILSPWIRRTPGYIGLVLELQSTGYTVIAADPDGEDVPSSLTGREKLVLALGNEASGLTDILIGKADYRVAIPIMREKAESLNVAACGAICMYLSSR